ncbi:hypothetical protein PICMEDRAFT_100392 [Pichia membranifaciens NRRL Y-2026]|uniref:Uncharacterized protein n=1 Tax=Pichia membranifaciens NRRL Y-2026 TaxID=763406 RepID=A0A1E3NTC3_9ASCO|nr:hypothetical protein PICMEDRAFT_100392 [Pichia membranifaciens NRRL Y-2026]ODQ49351.1 hypothetical protein PICMEDRAFT_100392 [Pichia membranifaciens NRRL Y-2026]
MDGFADSLNSQMRMLDINKSQQHGIDPTVKALQIGNNFSIKMVSDNNSPLTTGDHADPLPNDVESLKNLLSLRIRYTRPKQGGYWEFEDVPSDVSFLQNCIRFIDKNCATVTESDLNALQLSDDNYDKILAPMEVDAKELEAEFGFRFYNHFSHKFLRKELVKMVKSSRYNFLANLLTMKRQQGEPVPMSWRMYSNSDYLRPKDYIRFFDKMDRVFKEWILDYCISNVYVRDSCMDPLNSTYDVLLLIERNQNISFQLKLLIDILIENSGANEHLTDSNNFLPYLTYVDHLEQAIQNSMPACKNPYRTAMLLMLVTRGMAKFPQLLSEFQIRLSEFLSKYPDFTLGQLVDYLKQNNLPNVGNMQQLLIQGASK